MREWITAKSDEQLLQAAQKGDKEAFKELIIRLESRVASTVIGMLGNCPEADDVGQETFIRFYKALDSFRGDCSVARNRTDRSAVIIRMAIRHADIAAIRLPSANPPERHPATGSPGRPALGRSARISGIQGKNTSVGSAR